MVSYGSTLSFDSFRGGVVCDPLNDGRGTGWVVLVGAGGFLSDKSRFLGVYLGTLGVVGASTLAPAPAPGSNVLGLGVPGLGVSAPAPAPDSLISNSSNNPSNAIFIATPDFFILCFLRPSNSLSLSSMSSNCRMRSLISLTLFRASFRSDSVPYDPATLVAEANALLSLTLKVGGILIFKRDIIFKRCVVWITL